MSQLCGLIADRIREFGPISFAEFMRLSLYHPTEGYYARAARRTGRAGDFFTSVDVGPLFGELLARQLAEMWEILGSSVGASPGESPASAKASAQPRRNSACRIPNPPPPPGLRRGLAEVRFPSNRTKVGESRPGPSFDLVEAGAGSGQLARDILDAAARHYPAFYQSIRLHLVEISPAARAAQTEMLGPHAAKLVSSCASMPETVAGAILANELLDALPTHAVVMRTGGLREVFVDVKEGADGTIQFVECERALSTPDLESYLDTLGVKLKVGWRAEINLEARKWVEQAARVIDRGFLLLMDYGHEAEDLYSASHSGGTITAFRRHTTGDRASPFENPGEYDISTHVDLTTVSRTAESSGLVTLGRVDQTYFLLGLGLGDAFKELSSLDVAWDDHKLVERSRDSASGQLDGQLDTRALKRRLALKTLVLPGGLGDTMKVLIFGKNVGVPSLTGLSYKGRLT